MLVKELFSKANHLANTGGLDEALEITATLLQHDPDNAMHIALAGKIMANKHYYGVAIPLIERAIEKLPVGKRFDLNRAEYYNNLGFCSRFLNQHDKGREYFRMALKYAQEKEPDIYGNLAALYVARGEAKEGLRLNQKALDADPDNQHALNNKSILLLELGNYAEGFDIYDARMVIKEEGKQWKRYPGNPPLWDGTKGKSVLVYGEQGIGDEIMFASMLPDIIRDCTVVFDCNERLMNLFRQSFDIDIYGTKREDETKLQWPRNYRFDAMLPIGSLGKFYRRKEEDFPRTPYIKCSEEAKDRIGKRVSALGNRRKIGISWLGGAIDTHCWERHIPIQKLKPLMELDADFVSLQYDEKAGEEIKKSGLPLIHMPDILQHKDYEETAALVANLDLVISVPQSVVHLSGSMGVPTWQMTPKRAMWQMGVYGKDMPWYGSVKSYWQEEAGNWDSVLSKVREDLCLFLKNTGN